MAQPLSSDMPASASTRKIAWVSAFCSPPRLRRVSEFKFQDLDQPTQATSRDMA